MSSIENLMASAISYCFDYPPEIEAKTGLCGLAMSKREFYQILSRDVESDDPKLAAFYREIASYFPDCDQRGYQVSRDGNHNMLIDFDDWDELSTEQQCLRGNRGAAIALLDRLRFHLEMMDDDIGFKEEVDDIRRALNELVEPLSMM